MTFTIWKFMLPVTNEQGIELPKGSTLLTLMVQSNIVYLYASVDITQELVSRNIYMFGTGQPEMDLDNKTYIGSFILPMTNFVGHVYIGEENG